ncbi:1,6-anhydro-N-acetylmuramyl-L-alanine amidase AmpD [Rubrivivax albus]|uniref:1,6-anhydro-N-acetylmuramyl-L-alanine amidase AmpD n=1 Tax=Rubrivivax albus TaxID=2499835 RepID=A0A3S2TN79_9BURK|nr:1,6-anhydro-N-acetylmuramyl-L-alanine amidase AmpD [Rubrivivax albus]RVT52149.1 1,6-anhydro-N-acetylmuramyl-L-alanine amidase AmpD [Rubrivivax albus]
MAAPRTDPSRQARRPGAWRGGWWRWALRVRSPHHNTRPANLPVNLVVLHSISLPAGQFGGPWITDLFLGRLDTRAHESFTALAGLRVSAHFLIRRDGRVLQFVDTRRRAWHAGVSSWLGRANCNDFSVGIELEGLEGDTFESAQYGALARLLRALAGSLQIEAVVGHEHVAPGRKGDPGSGFDWARLRRLLRMRQLWVHGASPRPARAASRTGRRTGGIGRSTVRHTTASGL